MAFLQRPDGLIDVDTPMGPMPMAPEVAMQLGWTPGTAEAGVQGPAPMVTDPGATAQATGLNDGDREVLGLAPSHTPAPMFDQLAATKTDAELAVPDAVDPTTLPRQVATEAAQAQTQQAPTQPSGPSMLDLAMSLPAGTESSASTRSGPAPIVGPERKNIEAAQVSQLTAAKKANDQNAAISDMVTEQANAEAMKARAIQQNEIGRQQRAAAKIAEMQTKREELRRAVPDEIDESKWNKMGGAGSVLAAVSIMLGGISQGLTGRDNPGLAVVQDLMRQNVQNQKDEIALAQDAADTADNDLQRYMDLYGDPLLAEKQLEINDLEAMKKEMQARIQGSQSEADKALGVQGIAELEEIQARARNEMDGRAQQITTQSQFQGQDPADRMKMLAAAKAKDDAVNDPYAGMNDASRRDALARRVRLPDGTDLWSPSAEHATKLKPLITSHARYKKNTARLRELMNDTSLRTFAWGQLNPKVKGEIEALTRTNTVLWRDILQLGALTGADQTLVAPLTIEEAGNFWSRDPATMAKMDAADAFADDLYTGAIRDMDTSPDNTASNPYRKTTEQQGWRRTK